MVLLLGFISRFPTNELRVAKNAQKRIRIDLDSVTTSKNALGIWYVSCTIFRIGEFVVLNSRILDRPKNCKNSLQTARISYDLQELSTIQPRIQIFVNLWDSGPVWNTKHLNKHNILYDLQHGFRQKRSCETQLIQLVEDLGRQLIQGKQTDLVLLDFSKAFDKVNHLKLLFKLSQHGVKGDTLNWIRAFLVGRTQAVVLEGESSSEVPVTSGVPQGSVLGPLLFLLYINDLPQNIQSQVRLFADDTAVYLTVNSHEAANTLQADIDTLQEWELTWDMEFNPSHAHYKVKSTIPIPIHPSWSDPGISRQC